MGYFRLTKWQNKKITLAEIVIQKIWSGQKKAVPL